jgi:hypothetical protein
MYIQEQRKHEYTCPSGLCPEGIEIVKDIALTPLEKKAIFLSFQRMVTNLKESLKK